jgi:hypothetical protein
MLGAATFIVENARAVEAGAITTNPAVLAGNLIRGVSEVVSVSNLFLPPAKPRGKASSATERSADAGFGVHQAEVKGSGAPFHVECSLCSAL